MVCQKCGKELNANATFCGNCGMRVQLSNQTASAGTKSKSSALVLEILPGIVGILGIGWIYAGETQKGILILVGNIIIQIGLILTTGVGPICTVPLGIVLSAYMLNQHIKKSPLLWT